MTSSAVDTHPIRPRPHPGTPTVRRTGPVTRRAQVLVVGPEATRFAQLLRPLPQLRPPVAHDRVAAVARADADLVVLLTDRPAEDVRAVAGLPGRGARILVLSPQGGPEDVVAAVTAGAVGYLVRGEFGRAELVRAVLGTLSGQCQLSRTAANSMVRHLHRRRPATGLRPRQQEVLRLAALGETNAQIAARLRLSEKTIRNQLSEIYGALGVHNRTEAVLHWLDR